MLRLIASEWGKLLVLIAAAAAVLLFALAWMDLEQARWFQAYLGYYFCGIATMVTLWFLYRNWEASNCKLDARAARSAFLPVGLALAGTFLTLVHQPLQMRVFNDEPAHALVAATMAQERMVTTPLGAYYEGGAILPTDPSPVYRLYYYSFLVSVLHNLTGERVGNLYAINIAACFGLLLLAFQIGRYLSGRWIGGVLAQLLLVGAPLVSHVASSANYDMLNLCLLAAFFLSALNYLKEGSSTRLNLTISLGILLSYCRSESILFLLLLPLVFLLRSWQDQRLHLSFYSLFSPLFLLVPLAASLIAKQLSDTLSLFYTHTETGFFSPVYFVSNFKEFISWWFSSAAGDLNSLLLSVLGAGSLLLLPLVVWNHRRATKKIDCAQSTSNLPLGADLCLCLLWGVLAIHVGMLLFLYWSPTEASAIRFFLPLTLLSALSVVRVSGWLDRLTRGRFSRILAVLAFGYFWIFSMPKAARAELSNSSVPTYNAHRMLDWIQANDDGRTLYAVRSEFYPRLYGYPATSIRELNNSGERLVDLIGEGLYRRIVVIYPQYFSPIEHVWHQPNPQMPLHPSIQTQQIDGWRGFIHAESFVLVVLGVTTEAGEVISMPKPSASEAKQFESEEDYFRYIRALQP
jgi:hypothetical protein